MYNHNSLYKNSQIMQPKNKQSKSERLVECQNIFFVIFVIYSLFYFKLHFKFTFFIRKITII